MIDSNERLRRVRGAITVLCVLASCVSADAASLYTTNIESGTILFLTDLTSGNEGIYVKGPGRPWLGFDVDLSQTAGQAIYGTSFDAATIALQNLGPAPDFELTTSVFMLDLGQGSFPSDLGGRLVRQDNGASFLPADVSTVILDANDVLLDSDHVVMPDRSTVRLIPTRPVTVDPSGIQNIDLTFHLDSAAPQSETIQTGPGDIQVEASLLPNGDILGGVASDTEISLFVLDPVAHTFTPTSTVAANSAFHAPYIIQRNESNIYFMSIVDGQTIRSFSVDASSVTPGPTHALPQGATGGYIAADSTGNPVFAYVRNDTIFRGDVGAAPDTTIQFGNVNQTLNATTPAGNPMSFESLNGDVTVSIAQGYVPFSDDTLRLNAAGDARLVAHDLQNAVEATGNRAGVLLGFTDGQHSRMDDLSVSGQKAVALVVDQSVVTSGAPFDPLSDASMVVQTLNPAASLIIDSDPNFDGRSALAVMDTTVAAAGQRVATEAVVPPPASLFRFDLLADASANFVAGVVAHSDGSRMLHAHHPIGDLDGDDENDALSGGAVSEDGHALLTSDVQLPVVQQFRADVASATGDVLEVLSFVDVDLETDDRMRAQIEFAFPDPAAQPTRQADHLVISEVGYDTIDEAGSSTGQMDVELAYARVDSTGGGTLLALSGTPAEVAAQMQGFSLRLGTFPIPALPLTAVRLHLTYELTSLDGSTVNFGQTSGLVQIVPEPATASAVMVLVGVLAWCRPPTRSAARRAGHRVPVDCSESMSRRSWCSVELSWSVTGAGRSRRRKKW
ncbi:MAG: hypothetical protein CMJ18_03050 [Phycisphaeraceae bacterium]|nr:hypothetical protein [Phycisphaeraceae bacterium]